MRISPVELKSTDLTKLAYPRYTNISQFHSLDWFDLVFSFIF